MTLIGYRPTVPKSGVPSRIAVLLPMDLKVTQEGKRPDAENEEGNDLITVVKVNLPARPTMNVV